MPLEENTLSPPTRSEKTARLPTSVGMSRLLSRSSRMTDQARGERPEGVVNKNILSNTQ